MADKKQNPVKYGEVIAKCWEDEAYRKRFIEDPETVLSEAGFVAEEGVTYKVIEEPKGIKYLVIPYEGAKDAVQLIAKGLLNAAEAKDVIIPEGTEARIIQNTEDTRYLILPPSPKALTKNELSMAAGGTGQTAENVVTTVVAPVVEAQTVNVVSPLTVTEVGTVSPTAYVQIQNNLVVVLI